MKSTIHIAFRQGDTFIERTADVDMPEWDGMGCFTLQCRS